MLAESKEPSATERTTDDMKVQSIAVAVLTYKRTDLLEKFLQAFAEMNKPENADVALIVVDNDSSASAQALVEDQRKTIADIHYFVETRRGIPVARNRALDEALRLGADALCFIDDDEYPDPDWLVALVACWRDRGAHLIGGPVEVAPAGSSAGAWQRFVNSSLAARMKRKNRSTADRAATGGRYTVVTNNWLCDLNWQRETGLRFDEKLLDTGGSDTVFFHDARAAGAVTDWSPDAVVHETMTEDRLSLSYQFFRGASQSTNNFRRKHGKVSLPVAMGTVLIAALRFVLGALLLVIPIFGLASPVMATRSLGWSVGRVRALFGGQSTLYQ